MGYLTKIQKVERPTNQSFYVNLPSALAQSMDIEKGEEFEWAIENKNLLILQRVKKGGEIMSKSKLCSIFFPQYDYRLRILLRI